MRGIGLAVASPRPQNDPAAVSLRVPYPVPPGYIEIDVDPLKFKSASVFTKIAKPLVGMLLPKLKGLQIDIAFMFQA